MKNAFYQLISVTTQVAISRRVRRYKLALRDRQAARGTREHTGGVLMPMTWAWNVDEEEGQRWFATRERRLEEPSEGCYEEPSRRRQKGVTRSVQEGEKTFIGSENSRRDHRDTGGERLLQYWRIRFMSEWNMYDHARYIV